MAHWIIDDHGFGGTFYTCSECGKLYWDIHDDGGGGEECPYCSSSMDTDANVYMKYGRVEK